MRPRYLSHQSALHFFGIVLQHDRYQLLDGDIQYLSVVSRAIKYTIDNEVRHDIVSNFVPGSNWLFSNCPH